MQVYYPSLTALMHLPPEDFRQEQCKPVPQRTALNRYKTGESLISWDSPLFCHIPLSNKLLSFSRNKQNRNRGLARNVVADTSEEKFVYEPPALAAHDDHLCGEFLYAFQYL